MRVQVQGVGRQADGLQSLGCSLLEGGSVKAGLVQRFGHDATNALARVE